MVKTKTANERLNPFYGLSSSDDENNNTDSGSEDPTKPTNKLSDQNLSPNDSTANPSVDDSTHDPDVPDNPDDTETETHNNNIVHQATTTGGKKTPTRRVKVSAAKGKGKVKKKLPKKVPKATKQPATKPKKNQKSSTTVYDGMKMNPHHTILEDMHLARFAQGIGSKVAINQKLLETTRDPDILYVMSGAANSTGDPSQGVPRTASSLASHFNKYRTHKRRKRESLNKMNHDELPPKQSLVIPIPARTNVVKEDTTEETYMVLVRENLGLHNEVDILKKDKRELSQAYNNERISSAKLLVKQFGYNISVDLIKQPTIVIENLTQEEIEKYTASTTVTDPDNDNTIDNNTQLSFSSDDDTEGPNIDNILESVNYQDKDDQDNQDIHNSPQPSTSGTVSKSTATKRKMNVHFEDSSFDDDDDHVINLARRKRKSKFPRVALSDPKKKKETMDVTHDIDSDEDQDLPEASLIITEDLDTDPEEDHDNVLLQGNKDFPESNENQTRDILSHEVQAAPVFSQIGTDDVVTTAAVNDDGLLQGDRDYPELNDEMTNMLLSDIISEVVSDCQREENNPVLPPEDVSPEVQDALVLSQIGTDDVVTTPGDHDIGLLQGDTDYPESKDATFIKVPLDEKRNATAQVPAPEELIDPLHIDVEADVFDATDLNASKSSIGDQFVLPESSQSLDDIILDENLNIFSDQNKLLPIASQVDDNTPGHSNSNVTLCTEEDQQMSPSSEQNICDDSVNRHEFDTELKEMFERSRAAHARADSDQELDSDDPIEGAKKDDNPKSSAKEKKTEKSTNVDKKKQDKNRTKPSHSPTVVTPRPSKSVYKLYSKPKPYSPSTISARKEAEITSHVRKQLKKRSKDEEIKKKKSDAERLIFRSGDFKSYKIPHQKKLAPGKQLAEIDLFAAGPSGWQGHPSSRSMPKAQKGDADDKKKKKETDKKASKADSTSTKSSKRTDSQSSGERNRDLNDNKNQEPTSSIIEKFNDSSDTSSENLLNPKDD